MAKHPFVGVFCYTKYMPKTFFFYDLETSGLNAREDRVMQFAGQRTDMNLQPIGEPVNVLVALNDDTIPSPEALLVTGITPQKTLDEGYSEADFAKLLVEEWFTPDTIVVGFNNVRFDDEFIRHLLWRNFHDPYEWSWKEGRSRWDMLDVVRMTRALRPEGINWPVDDKGEPTNRLELITKLNGIEHGNAHDALSDVTALIDVARLIRDKQPQLFDYLLKVRDKKELQAFINLDNKQPFVYTSGRYDKQHAKTTVAFPLTSAPHGNVLVYDLRYDPTAVIGLTQDELKKRLFASWQERQEDGFVPVPVKQLQYNRCPAVAPLGVLSQADGWQKIDLSQEIVEKHLQILLAHPEFAENIRSVFESREPLKRSTDPEAQLYDGFVADGDKIRIEAVRNADAAKLADFQPEFVDERLPGLLVHYKARNFPRSLTETERTEWEVWRAQHIEQQLVQFGAALERVAKRQLTDDDKFVLDELRLWVESIVPEEH